MSQPIDPRLAWDAGFRCTLRDFELSASKKKRDTPKKQKRSNLSTAQIMANLKRLPKLKERTNRPKRGTPEQVPETPNKCYKRYFEKMATAFAKEPREKGGAAAQLRQRLLRAARPRARHSRDTDGDGGARECEDGEEGAEGIDAGAEG